jgi:hypothetical protein
MTFDLQGEGCSVWEPIAAVDGLEERVPGNCAKEVRKSFRGRPHRFANLAAVGDRKKLSLIDICAVNAVKGG